MNDESRDAIPSDVRVGGANRVLATFPDRQSTIVQVPMEKVSMLRSISDSTASICFYHSKWSLRSNPAQDPGIHQ